MTTMQTPANSGAIEANVVDIRARRTQRAIVRWQDGRISAIEPQGALDPSLGYLVPGFIDAHIHIESTMLTPAEFARMAMPHGTVASVSDPHEIANILGIAGIDFMHQSGAQSPFVFAWGAPSCVPATAFETNGAELDAKAIEALLREGKAKYLAEVMDFPGVLNKTPQVIEKINAASRLGYPVDGHAPGLRGAQARAYASAGIDTDHECISLAEARDKHAAGMQILIREGSAARNFAALHPLIRECPEAVMFCSDDKHPDALLHGHINAICAMAITEGHDWYDVLRCACLNPNTHYQLGLGQLRIGDRMDAALLSDPNAFSVAATWINGECVAREGRCERPVTQTQAINRFAAKPISVAALRKALPTQASASPEAKARVIEMRDGALDTQTSLIEPKWVDGHCAAQPEHDVLYLVVVNRYQPAPPAIALVRGFGLLAGALAGSIAHDSHNVIAVGVSLESVTAAINAVIALRGGIVVQDGEHTQSLALPIAGLMSDADGPSVANAYTALNQAAHELGSPLEAPFMSLSFMALLVIPSLKLSDQGLFNGDTMQPTTLLADP